MIKEKPFMVFDCESDAFDGQEVEAFIYGWKTSEGESGFTYDRDEFIDYLKNFDGLALAHNGGKFDTVMLADQFNIGTPIKIINGRVAEVKIGDAIVRDSFLIIPSPLAASGAKDDFDYSILDRNKKHLRKQKKKEIEKYLMQDCTALYDLVSAFYDKFGQRLTLAGAALNEWEKMTSLKRRWGGAHDNHFRQFYYGGRVNAYQKGALGDGWQYYDIKSSYPRAMIEEHTASYITQYTMHSNINKITPQSFARITAMSRGCLPSREKYSTEFAFDNSPREYFATGWEIIAGLETNTLKIFDATIYQPTIIESLAPYVNYFYQKKSEAEEAGNKVLRLLFKLFLNSLYGKYGSNPEKYHRYKIVNINERPEDYDLFMQCDDFDIVKQLSGGQFFDVALAASVTGYARAKLFRQMLKVDDLAYSDTDSIICRGGDFDIGKNLGQWEHVHTLNDFHVAGKKLYYGVDAKTGEKVTAHKGFSDLDIDGEDIINATFGIEKLIKRSAPSISITGQQSFISRTLRMT